LYARFFRDPLDPDMLLEQVGLGEVATTRYKVLSGGQKQRLGLALALLGRPELAILDEPTAGMDPAAKAATRELIGNLGATGTTVLLTTHELADVELMAGRIAIIDRGRIVAQGTPGELAAGSQARLRFRLDQALDHADRNSLASALGDGVLADDGPAGRYQLLQLEPSPAILVALTGWCAARGVLIAEIRTTGATLEERYLELTGRPAVEDLGG
ncbi:MAG: ATP-binding cassette domain-containing protein, partial [Candidatus Limnocylindrales bacterium]